jgi:hypothetical protein
MVYHRPNHQEDPNDPTAEISFKKIKKQKITGVKGSFLCQYNVVSRRFEFDGYDPIAAEIERRFNVTQAEIPMNIEKSNKIRENTNFLNKTKDEYSDYEQFDAPKGEAPF